MSKKANPTVVGSFVVGAIILSIIGIMLLGGASMFEQKFDCIMYFDESISGLDVGAPVDFQGVRIGTVTGVRLDFDRERGGEALRPVTLQFEGNRINFVSGKSSRKPEEAMEYLVTNRGMRARLASQSMLTGKLKVELGYFPNEPIMRKNRDPQLWELPTIPSPLKKMTTEMAQLPLAEIVNEAHRAIKGMADTLSSEKTGEAVKNLNQTLSRLESVLARVDAKIDPFAEQSTAVMVSAKASLDDLRVVLQTANDQLAPLLTSMNVTSDQVSKMLDPESPVRGELAILFDELREASKSLRRLTDYLQQHPEALLRGKN